MSIAYVNYWLEAVDAHSLQAPFIYNFYKEVVQNDEIMDNHLAIEKIRGGLYKDTREIKIVDLGAGSMVSKNTSRPVKSIARSALSSPKFCRLLYRLVQHSKAKQIVELGSSLGITASYLASANSNGVLHTIEGCKETAEVAESTLAKMNLKNVNLYNANIDTVLPKILESGSIDFAYIDANHTYEATSKYFKWMSESAHENSILVFDDIHWSSEMNKAWNEIKNSKEIGLSIDLFEAGIVIFNKSIPKQDYILSF